MAEFLLKEFSNQLYLVINPVRYVTSKGNLLEKLKNMHKKYGSSKEAIIRKINQLKGRQLVPIVHIKKQLLVEDIIYVQEKSKTIEDLIAFYSRKYQI